MKPRPFEELYAKLVPAAGPAAGAGPPDMQREIGHFNVFNVADLMRGRRDKPPMTFDRRAFYKISLIRGRSRVEYADQAVDVAHNALWFATHRVPYRWLPHDADQAGYFCVFTDEFLLPAKGGVALGELPVFQPGGCPVWGVTEVEFAALAAIFQKMEQEIASDYAYKYDLLRIYLVELIHFGQKLQPVRARAPTRPASARVAARFAELLERQFPLEGPAPPPRLRAAKDYADHLAVHVVHLNRVLKEATGHTTTALIGHRVAQEAKLLLKHTTQNVSEVAEALGFADVAHFCTFFKRQTGRTPGDFRG